MHIRDIFQRDRRTISFEFFPPKTNGGWEKLYRSVAELEPLQPSFVSVTYGAAGSTRENTHQLVTRINETTALQAIPHLTCVAHNERDIGSILDRYASASVGNILALHGDPPRHMTDYSRDRDTFRYAADLVTFIRKFNEGGSHEDRRGFGIGVAGFPEGHPDTPNRLVQMDHLKAKIDAGADWITTQMFFDNSAFYDFCERCQLARIDVPIVAGLMPITSITGMKRMADLAAGTNFPAPLLRAVYRCQDDPEAVARVGVHWATEQARDLLDHGVAGIHFYTLNQSDATRQIYQTLGARTSEALRG